jgi:hypothetical protein
MFPWKHYIVRGCELKASEGLALFASTPGVAQWSIATVRLCVDAGLLLIVLNGGRNR